ncbi:2OG-Fe(II) oxygenase [Pseudomonas marginalis]|uniref:2OG-Fe(II) oxygenase n=1 Tax=Pseudomonas marginalis TaxID=298 RepID=UPI00163AEF15|nr:2OG-Fe(II) oxygenase [Pseudomonas marginalis]
MGSLETAPYSWAEITNLYSAEDAAALAATYPHDHFKTVTGYGGEKNYDYEARALLPMGGDAIAYESELSEAWRRLARDLCSAAYRDALGALTDQDLRQAPMEVNVFHYGAGASLGPHPDLPDKRVTHILYFNESWDPAYGGCLNILRGKDPEAVVALVEPLVGNSAVLVRSDHSWHAVSPVVPSQTVSRRSVTVTFYQQGSRSSMWPEDDNTPLHSYPVD